MKSLAATEIDLVIFSHIPKNAGSSVNRVMRYSHVCRYTHKRQSKRYYGLFKI